MTFLDAHVHIWDASRFDYRWLSATPSLASVYEPADIDRGAGLTTRMVFVEADCAAHQSLDEARWVSLKKGDWPELAGIVAAADLQAGSRTTQALDLLGTVDSVVGVRHLLQNEPVSAWRVDALAEGITEVGRRGLTFDACVRHPQLPALADLLERVTGTRIVIDHLGKPPVDAGIDSVLGRAWRTTIRRLASMPHVHLKLSGLSAESSDPVAFDRHADAFLGTAFDAFGANRCMIGSDWPVSTALGVRTSLRSWADRVQRATAATSEEWAMIAEGSACRFYRLSGH